jgi:hypothetical protein
VASLGAGEWIAGKGGVGPSGAAVASGSSSSGETPTQNGAGASAAAAGGSASSFVAPPAQVVAAPSVTAAVAPGSPVASATSSESGPSEVHPDKPVLQRECDLARGRFSSASVEIDRLRKSLRVVEVTRSTVEEEAHSASDATMDALARAFRRRPSPCLW